MRFLIVKTREGRGVELQAIVRMRFLKGKRRKPGFKELTLRPCPPDLALYDPLLPLLSLALEDGVLKNVKDIDKLLAMPPLVLDRTGGVLEIPIDPAKKSLRVMRKAVRKPDGWVIDPVIGQPYASARGFLVKVGAKAGCIDKISFYAFRRTMIDFINSPEFTESDRRAAAGHNEESRVQAGSYLSRNTKIDTASFLTGKETVADAGAAVRGLRFFDGIPDAISAKGLEEVAQDEELVALVAQIQPLHDAVLAQFPTLSAAREAGSQLYAEYWDAYTTYQNRRNCLIRAKRREETEATVSSHIDSVLLMAQADEPDWDAILARSVRPGLGCRRRNCAPAREVDWHSRRRGRGRRRRGASRRLLARPPPAQAG